MHKDCGVSHRRLLCTKSTSNDCPCGIMYVRVTLRAVVLQLAIVWADVRVIEATGSPA